jgi:two-component system sensor histidine kinase RegB
VTSSVERLALPWIVRLRYGLVAGEILLLVAISLGLQISLPIPILMIAVATQIATNLALGRAKPSAPNSAENIVGSLFVLDALCLTLILAATGGPTNPFSLLYLVQITFSAVMLRSAWTWALGIVSVLLFGLLFAVSTTVPAFQTHNPSGELSLHLIGMWIAFATAAILISYFVAKVSEEARQKEQELLSMQKQLAKNERLASLVTLSAGAAHEIATPLSTIAISAKEIERYATSNDPQLIEDAKLIRSEVERCRLILERMGAQGADPFGEAPSPIDLQELLSKIRDKFPDQSQRIELKVDSETQPCSIPVRATVEALSALVKNALDASPRGQPVFIGAQSTRKQIRFVVQDQGIGMPPDVIDRVAEPFFTTKPPGQGMGLGAFLAHLFAQRLGGNLSFESTQGSGCTAIMELPVTGPVTGNVER